MRIAVRGFMLAARSHGLGIPPTRMHPLHEREAARILGIPYQQAMQVGLLPFACTLGTNFEPAVRQPLERMLRWDRW